MKLPSLPALRAFEVAARHLSFSKAGDELCVTHAAVSHQIRNLELWFETDLFLRKGRGVELTRAGELLFLQLSPALADIAETCRRVKSIGSKQTLTVGCIPSIASRWLVPNLNDFTSQQPELDVRVVYAMAHQNLSDTDLDVLITLGTANAPGIASSRVFSRITKPVCSPSFLAEHGPISTNGHFTKIPLLHDETREGWKNWFKQAGVNWPEEDTWPVYQDSNLLASAAIAGHGVALCPVDTFRMEIEYGDLIILSDIAINQDAAYFASHRSDAGPAITEFVTWFSEISAAP